jgi:2'-5' RNA ligase
VTPLPEQPRLFVAVELDGDVRQALNRLQHDLQRHHLTGMRWVRPEGVHLTLKFLGETPREGVASITEALSTSTAGVAPHELSLGKLGTFGSRNAPRVLWVDLEGDLEALLRLQEQVERALTPLGFPRDRRSPHLTWHASAPRAHGPWPSPGRRDNVVTAPSTRSRCGSFPDASGSASAAPHAAGSVPADGLTSM